MERRHRHEDADSGRVERDDPQCVFHTLLPEERTRLGALGRREPGQPPGREVHGRRWREPCREEPPAGAHPSVHHMAPVHRHGTAIRAREPDGMPLPHRQGEDPNPAPLVDRRQRLGDSPEPRLARDRWRVARLDGADGVDVEAAHRAFRGWARSANNSERPWTPCFARSDATCFATVVLDR